MCSPRRVLDNVMAEYPRKAPSTGRPATKVRVRWPNANSEGMAQVSTKKDPVPAEPAADRAMFHRPRVRGHHDDRVDLMAV